MVSPRKWSEKYWKVSFYRCSIHQKSGIAWWTLYHDYHVLVTDLLRLLYDILLSFMIISYAVNPDQAH